MGRKSPSWAPSPLWPLIVPSGLGWLPGPGLALNPSMMAGVQEAADEVAEEDYEAT